MARRSSLRVTSQHRRDAAYGGVKHRESQQKGAGSAETGLFTASQCVHQGVGTWCPELLRDGCRRLDPKLFLFSPVNSPSATTSPKHIIGRPASPPHLIAPPL